MIYVSKQSALLMRQVLKQEQFKIANIQSILSIASKEPNINESEYVDALVITGEEFKAIPDYMTIKDKINSKQLLYVITKDSFGVVSDNIRYAIPDKTRLQQIFNSLDITPIQVRKVSIGINRAVEAEAVEQKQEEIPMTPVEPRQDVVAPIQEVKEEVNSTPKVELDKVVSLTKLTLSDIVRIAESQNEKFKSIKNQLSELNLRLKSANVTDIDGLLNAYLKQEDDACIELVNEFKKIIKTLLDKYNSSIAGRVDSVCEEVYKIASKRLYGLDQIELDKLLRERNKALNAAREILNSIVNDYSHIDKVASELAYMLQKFSFSPNINNLPFIYDNDSLSEARFQLFKELVNFKTSLTEEFELRDKVGEAIALLATTNDLTDKLMQARVNASIFNIKKVGIDYIVNTGNGVLTTLKLVIMKNKMFSLSRLYIIDSANYKEDIEGYCNTVTYVPTVDIEGTIGKIREQDPEANIICISELNKASGVSLADRIYIPTDVRHASKAISFQEKLEESMGGRTAIVVTPCDYETGLGIKCITKVIVPYVADLAVDKMLEYIYTNQQLFKVVSEMR